MNGIKVEVPGGQATYVNADGAIGYTAANSVTTPPGAFIGGFVNVTVVDTCGSSPITIFNWASPDDSSSKSCSLLWK